MEIFCILLIIVVATSVFLAVYGSRNNSSYDEDAVIVLGYGVKNGKVPGMLKLRLDKAIEYHSKNPKAIIIVSGGKGDGANRSESEIMKEYLVENGIPDSMIIKEDKSRTTVQNFKFSSDLIREGFGYNCPTVVITNVFHIFRSERYAKAAKINVSHISAKTNPCNIPWIYIREVAMLVQMIFILGRNFK